VNPDDGLYEPLPDTLTGVPAAVPPVEQSDGAEDCGPNTLNVNDPDGDAPPDNPADTDNAPIAEPAAPDAGAPADNDGKAGATIVSAIAAPHTEAAGLSFASPP
jgi:hypothetical protein